MEPVTPLGTAGLHKNASVVAKAPAIALPTIWPALLIARAWVKPLAPGRKPRSVIWYACPAAGLVNAQAAYRVMRMRACDFHASIVIVAPERRETGSRGLTCGECVRCVAYS